jgi:hypothetical protein
MRLMSFILLGAALGLHADTVLLHVPSPTDVEAKVPAQPPVYSPEFSPSPNELSSAANKTSQPTDKLRSPDGTYLAATDTQPDQVAIWRNDLKHGVLVVALMESGSENYTVSDSRNLVVSYVRYDIPRAVAQLGWSPDSQYLVMTTTDISGHSPWHFNALAYSVKTKTLRTMDTVIGDVISPSFKFVGPHTVEMSVAPPNRDFAHPLTINVDLDKKFQSMPREKGRTMGESDN